MKAAPQQPRKEPAADAPNGSNSEANAENAGGIVQKRGKVVEYVLR